MDFIVTFLVPFFKDTPKKPPTNHSLNNHLQLFITGLLELYRLLLLVLLVPVVVVQVGGGRPLSHNYLFLTLEKGIQEL